MTEKNHLRKDMPELDEPIFAVVETVSGTEYYIGEINGNEDLVDLEYGDGYGWKSESIDCWCPLETVVKLINGDRP